MTDIVTLYCVLDLEINNFFLLQETLEIKKEYIILNFHRALGLPTSDLTYDDCKMMIRARQMNLPHFEDIVEVEKLRQKIG